MNVLVINTGSSSIKFQLVNTKDQTAIASGLVERIGPGTGKIKYSGKAKIEKEMSFPNHKAGLAEVARLLQDAECGVISDANEIVACGHRTVHGGEEFSESTLVDEKVIETMKKCIPLAPLHNPANITGVEEATKIFPKAKHVAVFDTAFHQTMPPKAFRYAVPDRYYKEDGVRKYGFHGTSHLYVSREAAKMIGKKFEETNTITVHVGNGGSIAAVKGGISIDTTMGMTPLAGLVMGTRCGDIDPALPNFLYQTRGLSMDEVDTILNKESGMKGLTGLNDLRDIEEKILAGDENCKIAMEIYTYKIKKTIGAFYAALGTVDTIVFTAGVGENSIRVREMACEGLEALGIELDKELNALHNSEARDISMKSSKVKILVIPTNEELEIANQTVEVLKRNN